MQHLYKNRTVCTKVQRLLHNKNPHLYNTRAPTFRLVPVQKARVCTKVRRLYKNRTICTKVQRLYKNRTATQSARRLHNKNLTPVQYARAHFPPCTRVSGFKPMRLYRFSITFAFCLLRFCFPLALFAPISVLPRF